MQVAFVIGMHNHALITAQALLEVFRTAHEAESAEYVIVDDASTDDIGIVLDTIRRLQMFFGVSVKFIRNSTPAGYGASCHQGDHLLES